MSGAEPDVDRLRRSDAMMMRWSISREPAHHSRSPTGRGALRSVVRRSRRGASTTNRRSALLKWRVSTLLLVGSRADEVDDAIGHEDDSADLEIVEGFADRGARSCDGVGLARSRR